MYSLSFFLAGKHLFRDSNGNKIKFIFALPLKESEGQGCPFCRAEIKGTELVVVDPFEPGKNNIRSVLNSSNNSALNITIGNESIGSEEVLDSAH